MLREKIRLKNLAISQENAFAGTSFLIKLQAEDLQLYLKETPVYAFSWEFYEIFNKSFIGEHLRAAASEFFRVTTREKISVISWKIT